MSWEMPRFPGEWDSFHVEVRDERRVLAALESACARHGFAAVAPGELLAYGRWLHGEEDPSCRRFLVSPPGARWTTILPSAADWHLDWSSEMAAALGCRAVYRMLADGDVFSLHLFDGPAYVAGYLSSTDFFDLPPRATGDLGVDLGAVLAFCRAGTTLEELAAALAPPGPTGVDGELAGRRTAELLELPALPALSYREALEDDGRTVRPELAGWTHLAWRETGDADPAEDGESEGTVAAAPSLPAAQTLPGGGVLLPFRRRGK